MKNRAAVAMAALRWLNPDADKGFLREVGKLGGRPLKCLCGECITCKRRAYRAGLKARKNIEK